jgi:hypothetical protein
MRIKKIVAAALFAGVLSLPSPALAFHHTAVPSDECATVGDLAGNNPVAHEAIDGHLTLPIAPAGTSSEAPTDCPAPQK